MASHICPDRCASASPTSRAKPNVNYGLWVIIIDGKKCNTQVGELIMREAVHASGDDFCEPKITLKKKKNQFINRGHFEEE